jgi:hypothetical protein
MFTSCLAERLGVCVCLGALLLQVPPLCRTSSALQMMILQLISTRLDSCCSVNLRAPCNGSQSFHERDGGVGWLFFPARPLGCLRLAYIPTNL